MKETEMGLFKEEITLVNAGDKIRIEDGVRKEIRSVTVRARPDTGAWTLVINEDVRQALGLAIVGTRSGTLADGTTGAYGLTEPVGVRWKNRDTVCQAAVLPRAKGVLLGAQPLEGLDLYVDPVNQQLAGVHGDEPVGEIC
jgi:clan AA aspartic protease